MIQTKELMDLIKNIYDPNFKYSKLDFWFRKDAFLYQDTEIGMGKTRYFDYIDVVTIVSCAVCLDITHDINVSRKVATDIRGKNILGHKYYLEELNSLSFGSDYYTLQINIQRIREEVDKYLDKYMEVTNDSSITASSS